MANIVEVILRAVDNASGTVKAAVKTLEGTASGVRTLGLALGAAGTAIEVGLFAAAKVTANYGEELKRVSAATGVGVERLSALRFAAEQSEVSFEDLQGGLRLLTRSIIDAQDPTSKEAKLFAQLGISTKDAAGNAKSADGVMLELADKLRQLENPTDRAAVALLLMGRSGTNMLPFLTQGSAGILQLTNRARELGVVMDKDAVEASDRFNDTLNEARRGMQGLVLTVGTQLLPMLTDLAAKVTAAVVTVSTWTKEHQGVIRTLAPMAAGLGAVLVVLGGIGAILPSVIAGFGLLAGSLTLLVANLPALVRLAGILATIAALEAGFSRAAAEIENLRAKLKFFTDQGLITQEFASQLAAQFINAGEAGKDATRKIVEGLDAIARARGLIPAPVVPGPVAPDQTEEIIKRIRLALDELGKTAVKTVHDFEFWKKEIQRTVGIDAAQALEQMAARWEAAAKSMLGSLGSVETGFKNFSIIVDDPKVRAGIKAMGDRWAAMALSVGMNLSSTTQEFQAMEAQGVLTAERLIAEAEETARVVGPELAMSILQKAIPSFEGMGEAGNKAILLILQALSRLGASIPESVVGPVQAAANAIDVLTQNLHKSIEATLVGIAKGTRTWGDLWTTIWHAIVEAVIAELLRIAAVQALITGAAGFFGGVVRGFLSIFGIRLQEGGLVTAPTFARIAETEPELVVPLSKLRGMGLGGGGTVHVHLSGVFEGDREFWRTLVQRQIGPLLQAELAR